MRGETWGIKALNEAKHPDDLQGTLEGLLCCRAAKKRETETDDSAERVARPINRPKEDEEPKRREKEQSACKGRGQRATGVRPS